MAQYAIHRFITRLMAVAGCFLIFGFQPASLGAEDNVVSGTATAIDGQTLEIGGKLFSLHGIVAPVPGDTCQWTDITVPCGIISRTALTDLIIASVVHCRATGDAPLPDGSIPARCDVDGFDVGRNMVHTGWAVADQRVSHDYTDTEEKARAAERGLWKGTFPVPWNN